MESSISSTPNSRSEVERPKTTSRDKDKTDTGKSTPSAGPPGSAAPRVTRHKEKFLAMKEKYEEVIATHEKYERELAVANEKMRTLQNECNLLLDAVDIAVPGQPTLLHYLQHEQVAPHFTNANVPVYPELVAQTIEPVDAARAPVAVPTNGTNGHI